MAQTNQKNPKKGKKHPIIDMDKAQAREYWKQLKAEHDIEQQWEANSQTEKTLEVAYGDHPELEQTQLNDLSDKELKNDWEQLRRIAKMKFPEGARHSGLSPLNRLVGVAYCLGWPTEKIIKASRLHNSTVWRWLNQRADIQLFMDEFNMKIGTTDVVKNKFAALEYNGVQVVEEILRDKAISAATRLDAVKWIFDRSRGKASQPIEHTGNLVRDLIKTLQRTDTLALDPETETDLFPKSSKQTN